MGLLDQVVGGLTGKGSAQPGSGGLGSLLGGLVGGQAAGGDKLLAALLPVVLGWLQGRGEGGAAAPGLTGLLGQLRSSGLGAQVDSWLSTGTNLPVSGEQITQALGQGRIAELATQAGVGEAEASQGLAALLPALVDQLSPKGQLPGATELGDALGSLRKLLGR